MNKGVSEILSVVLIMLITTSLAGTALMWGMPLIAKRQDTVIIDRVHSYFNQGNSNSIVKKIEFVSKNGGQENFNSNVDGIWVISEEDNYLEFTTFGKVTNVAQSSGTPDFWVSLTPGGTCPPINGIVGIDTPYVVCAKADPYSDGYNVTYRIMFRELEDVAGERGWKINIVIHPSGESIRDAKSIRISQGQVTSESQGAKTLFTTEVKVLLV